MTGTDVLKESIRCECRHCKEEAMADEIAALRAERDALRAEVQHSRMEFQLMQAHSKQDDAEISTLRAERNALRKVYDAAARYCYNRTVENEHGLTGATWDALAVQP